MIEINENLRLRPYGGHHDFALVWYQNIETVKMVDGVNQPYDQSKLDCMYHYLNTHYELYWIEVYTNHIWLPIGDVSFGQDDMPIVIGDIHYRGMGIGKKVVKALIERGKNLGYPYLKVQEIYHENVASKKLFTSCGFKEDKLTSKGYSYRLEL